jgi:N-acetyl-anhydromuramyl-L-alanine amidase AmpD
MLSIALSSGTVPSCTPAPSLPPRLDFSQQAPSRALSPAAAPLGTPSVSPLAVDVTSSHPWQPEAPAREWTSIVIHHTATDHGSVESINESHLEKKWLGIGYHFVIGNGSGMADGAIEPTFRWREQLHGAHAGDDEYNQHGIGIALIGNFETERPTPAQLAAVKRLVGTLRAAHGIPAERVLGHSDVKATACPGKLFPLAEVSRSLLPQFINRTHPGTGDQARWSLPEQSAIRHPAGHWQTTARN